MRASLGFFKRPVAEEFGVAFRKFIHRLSVRENARKPLLPTQMLGVRTRRHGIYFSVFFKNAALMSYRRVNEIVHHGFGRTKPERARKYEFQLAGFFTVVNYFHYLRFNRFRHAVALRNDEYRASDFKIVKDVFYHRAVRKMAAHGDGSLVYFCRIKNLLLVFINIKLSVRRLSVVLKAKIKPCRKHLP